MSESYLHRFIYDERSVSAEEAARVFDSLDQVSDARSTTFVGSSGRSITPELQKDRGFLSTLGKIAKDNLKELGRAALEDVAGFFNSSLEGLQKVVGYEQLKSWFDKAFSKKIDLTKLDDDQVQQLVNGIKQTKSFKDKGSLIQFLDTELKSRKEQRKKEEKEKLGRDASKEAQERVEKQADEDAKRVEKSIEDAVSAIPDEELPNEGSDSVEVGLEEKLPLPVLMDLRPIIYGRVDLPKGVYILSVAEVDGESLEQLNFNFPIEKVVKWKEYKAYMAATQKEGVDVVSLDELADQAVDESLTAQFEGMDFLDFLKNNEASGDIEVEYGYLPTRDGRSVLLANVNKTSSAFTISAPAAVVSEMFVPFSVGN